MMTIIYRLIALLIFVFTSRELFLEKSVTQKVNVCMVMIPLALRILMIK